jgi:hypothetical protein
MPRQPALPELHLNFHGRIIDHLGIQMYQSPVAAIAELVANGWDADAEQVRIGLPADLGPNALISVSDNGTGMKPKDCQEHYLNVGWNRRGTQLVERSPKHNRPVLGRKGIGKFAGFGIASAIKVETISEETGERTVFKLELKDLRSDEYVSKGARIPVLEYDPPDDERRRMHGTTVTLSGLTLARRPSTDQFALSMARRFVFYERTSPFAVYVDGKPLPEAFEDSKVQFSFPRDYRDGEGPAGVKVESEWGKETLPSGRAIRWRVFFYKDTIDEEELRGVSIFAHAKLAQAPFFFNLAGGLGGQHGQEYMSGQVHADYLDELSVDVITTERQRIRWEDPETAPLLEWGRQRVKDLLNIWRDRRGEERIKELERKVARFSARLERLARHEAKTVRSALKKLAQIPTLTKAQFDDLGDAVLTAWEQGRLRELISGISETDTMNEQDLIKVLLEAQVLTALNVAEAVRTKLDIVANLRDRIANRDLENAVRNYIAQNPWLIAPEWETFRVEKSVTTLMKAAADRAGLVQATTAGSKRFDLALSSGDHLLIVEFMAPGKRLDWDHINRFDQYVRIIRTTVDANTGGQFRRVTGYLVADGLTADAGLQDRIKSMRNDEMYAMDWPTLFAGAVKTWREFLEILVSRAPEDPRLKSLLEGL